MPTVESVVVALYSNEFSPEVAVRDDVSSAVVIKND